MLLAQAMSFQHVNVSQCALTSSQPQLSAYSGHSYFMHSMICASSCTETMLSFSPTLQYL